jgi:hypothetical protein
MHPIGAFSNLAPGRSPSSRRIKYNVDKNGSKLAPAGPGSTTGYMESFINTPNPAIERVCVPAVLMPLLFYACQLPDIDQ